MTLGELAQRFNLTLSGDAQRSVSGLATLGGAGPDHVSFIASRKYLKQLADTAAAAVLIHPDFADQCPVNTLVTEDPYLAFARMTSLFDRSSRTAVGRASSRSGFC